MSAFDYVSVEAFEELGIRRGVRREPFEYWLPLAINASVRILSLPQSSCPDLAS